MLTGECVERVCVDRGWVEKEVVEGEGVEKEGVDREVFLSPVYVTVGRCRFVRKCTF